MNIAIFIGCGLITFFLLYFIIHFQTKDSIVNAFIQIIGLGFIFVFLIILSVSVLDEQDYCSIVAENSTINGSTTTYDYNYFCYTNPNPTSTNFYQVVMWFIRIIAGFFLVYIIYILGKALMANFPLLRGGKRR